MFNVVRGCRTFTARNSKFDAKIATDYTRSTRCMDPKLFNKLIAINYMGTCNQASA